MPSLDETIEKKLDEQLQKIKSELIILILFKIYQIKYKS